MNWIGGKETAALLGMPKAGFYRMLKRLMVEKEIDTGVTVWVVECWGGIRYPGQHWRFLEDRVRDWIEEQLNG